MQAQSFLTNTGITYPLLRSASTVGSQYAPGWDNVFVVDPGGFITLKNTSGFTPGQVQVEVDRLLALTPAGPEVPRAGVRVAAPWPNPFNPRTQIAFRLDGEGSARVRVDVFDLRGRALASLWDRVLPRGQRYEVPWDGQDAGGTPLPSGVYQLSVTVDGHRQTRPVTLVR